MNLGEHEGHKGWTQVGRCVYCSCGVRLGQGTVPDAMRAPAKSHDCNLCAYKASKADLLRFHLNAAHGVTL